MQPFWEAYEGGATLSELIRRIVQIYREDIPKQNIDMSFFKEFDKVKDRICYRLIHFEKNKTLLEKIPYIPFLDLAICFYYAYEDEVLGRGSILIHHSHMEMWKTSVAELMCHAQNNTPGIFPWECISMENMLNQLMGNYKAEFLADEEEQKDFFARMPMYIVSNTRKLYGACCVLYPGLLTLLADKLDGDFYILPSSIHEVILLKDTKTETPEQLRKMIREVNETHVEPEEVLSDSLYYYSRKDKKIRIV